MTLEYVITMIVAISFGLGALMGFAFALGLSALLDYAVFDPADRARSKVLSKAIEDIGNWKGDV